MSDVPVLNASDVCIRKWHRWSDWIDICIYNYGSTSYLLQMKVSKSNKKRFRSHEIAPENSCRCIHGLLPARRMGDEV